MFYKMVNNLVPSYLTGLIPDNTQQRSGYSLRNRHALQVPFARTSRFYNYFTVSTVRLWNDLDEALRNLPSLDQFKSALKRTLGYATNKLYIFSNHPLMQIHHTRLRLGLSSLAGHLHDYGIIEDGTCQYCFFGSETLKHYVFQCPIYGAARASFLSKIPQTLPQNLLFNTSEDDLLFGLIHGFPATNLRTNFAVFDIFEQFLFESGRFS
jgi:hypothetical protein